MNENKVKLSIIVPVYNVSNYLKKCIDSILNQEFQNFEVIAVDDGSTDDSGEILDEYALKDHRIKVVHIQNGGVSNARNIALSMATGEYIGFVDSDDEIEEHMYEKLLHEAELDNELDIVQCQFMKIYENKPFEKGRKKGENIVVSGNGKILYEWFLNKKIHQLLVTKIFKREIVENIQFNKNIAMAEDALFIFECLRKVEKLKIINHIGYFYFQRKDSVVHQKFNEKYFGILEVSDICKDYYSPEDAFYRMLECNEAAACVNMLLGIMREDVFVERFDELRTRLMKLKWKVFFEKTCNWKVKTITLLLWISPCLCKQLYKKHKGI